MTAAISLSGETRRQRIGELIRLARTRELNHSIEVDFDEREPRFRASQSSVVVQERRLGRSGAEIRLDFADTEAELVKRLMHRQKYSFEDGGTCRTIRASSACGRRGGCGGIDLGAVASAAPAHRRHG